MKLLKFSSKAFLAPMAGLTDPALRLLCKDFGAGLVVTELTSIHAVVARQKDLKEFVKFSDKERPISVQLFGSDIKMLKDAVKIISSQFDMVDYNMGCPSPKITEQMAGAALLQKPELTREIFKTLVNNSTKPVSLKMRTGVNKPDKFLQIAKIAEEEGIQMITLHARTLKQGYSGEADWSLIKKLKESVSIPVVGNGDINKPEDAKRMLDKTKCDYVMVGRAAAKNPFIFTQINQYLEKGSYDKINLQGKINNFIKYLEYAKNYNIKFANIKAQAMNFSKCEQRTRKLRANIMKVKSLVELREVIEEFLI